MRDRYLSWIRWIALSILSTVIIVILWDFEESGIEKEGYSEREEASIETKKARADYFYDLLRDPASGRIPPRIRSRELSFSRSLPVRRGDQIRMKSSSGTGGSRTMSLSWQSPGPKGLGGRTRALAIDQRNSDIIIAGGVSGGIWKSTDGGNSWQMKTEPTQNMSVTNLAQDPTSPDTWYYSSGEYSGNSAGASGASYYGTGIFKSTDNGESWSRLAATEDTDTGFTSPYDYVNRIQVSPATGSVFFSSNAIGLYRSTDGGTSFSLIKGGINEHVWTDFDIDSNGNIIAILSSESFTTGGSPGIFYSRDDGDTWTEITPADFPSGHDRSVISFAPSDTSTVYVFSEKSGSSTNQGISFFKLDLANNTSEDRSANIPDFGSPVGEMNLQGGYNMVISVKPDDPDFVLVGGTNLYRSTDGFATKPSGGYDNSDTQQKEKYWIGGYARANNVSQYPNHHPDQHVIAWDPNDPNTAWSGNDGGLSSTSDITAVPVNWTDKDNGYVTGQFYTVAIPSAADDDRIMGGTQDNGTPYFRINDSNQQATTLSDVSSGDGAYAHWGTNYAYVSTQNGKVERLKIENDGDLTRSSTWSDVYPSGAANQLFIHPYAVDPNDEGIMYYPGGREMWRNTTVDEIPNYNYGGTSNGWNSFTAVSGSGYTITALAISDKEPAERLYYGAYSSSGSPKIYRLDNATTSTDSVNISISGASSGAYIHDIAVNPYNGDEAIVVMSNYNIVGLYHTSDGGQTWTAIEGNLEGSSSDPGPSIRNAIILPTGSGTVYFVGTSTGVYSTSSLDGSNTSWARESAQGIGYSVSEYITSRPTDGKIAVGTHGRGIFLADVSVSRTGDGKVPAAPANVVASKSGSDNVISWDANSETDLLKYYIYRGDDSDNLQQYASVDASQQSYTDSNLGGKSRFYAVTAYDIEDNESPESGKVAIFEHTVSLDENWQLIGSPLANSLSPSNSDIKLFSFGSLYEKSSSIEGQKGYWAKSLSPDNVTFSGSARISSTISLRAGWNLVSGIADTIAVSTIEDPNGILSNSDTYQYKSGSYQAVTDLIPGKGYWIHADKSGDITMSINSSAAKYQTERPKADYDRLVFGSGSRSQQFLISSEKVSSNVRNKYRMPPLAPSPIIDVRTIDGFRLADSGEEELQLNVADFPLKVTLTGDASGSYQLLGINSRDTTSYKLYPNRTVNILKSSNRWMLKTLSANEQITEHKLLPNYPNPFNPTTTIRYQLASQEKVQIEVFNVLGRRVATLVNGQKASGMHEVRFNASDLSSGLYFVKIQAGAFHDIQKLTLIK